MVRAADGAGGARPTNPGEPRSMRDEAGPKDSTEVDRNASDEGEGAERVLADRALVARLRTGDDSAVGDLYERFESLLLEEARRRRVQPALRPEVVADVITRVALTLRKPTTRVPRSLGAYLTVALRRHVLNVRRAERRGEAHRADVDVDTLASPSSDEATVDGAPPSPMTVVWDQAFARLGERERELAGWLGDYVPQRHIAEWTGRTHDAVRSAAKRLRAKLRALVHELAAALPPDERAQVERRLARITGGVPRVDQRQGGRRSAPDGSRREP